MNAETTMVHLAIDIKKELTFYCVWSLASMPLASLTAVPRGSFERHKHTESSPQSSCCAVSRPRPFKVTRAANLNATFSCDSKEDPAELDLHKQHE